MDFASKGISWAESIFHKCEDMCREGIMVKEPGKFVDAVGEQLRKIYEEVTDDLLNPFSLVVESTPEDDLTADAHEKATSCCAVRSLDESSASPSSAVAFNGQSVAASPGPCHGSRGEECGVLDEDDTLTPDGVRSWSSSEVRVNAEEIPSITSADHLEHILSGEVLQSDVPQNFERREFHLLYLADPIEEEGISTSQDAVGQSSGCQHEQSCGLSEPEASLPSPAPEGSDGLGEQKAGYSVKFEAGDMESGGDEEFDDVGLEDFSLREKHVDDLEEADSCELALISQRAMKNHSYKKKLRDALASNFYSARKKWGARLGGGADARLVERGAGGAPASSGLRLSPARGLSAQGPSPCEPDWELV